MIVDKDSNVIVDSTCNTVSEATSNFIKSILIGHRITDDMQNIINEINERFFGMSKKALIVALKDGLNKYLIHTNQNKQHNTML